MFHRMNEIFLVTFKIGLANETSLPGMEFPTGLQQKMTTKEELRLRILFVNGMKFCFNNSQGHGPLRSANF